MTSSRSRPAPAESLPPDAAARPDVVLDVEVDGHGALHFVLANLGDAPAHTLRVAFSRSIRDLAGQRVNDNPLFGCLEFLPQGRRVPLLVDSLAGYLRRRQPLRFEARLAWQDDAGRAHKRRLTHDLAAWTQWRQAL